MSFSLFVAPLVAAAGIIEGRPLRVQLGAEPRSLDPTQVSDLVGYNIVSNIMVGLFRVDQDGKLQKGLTDSYSISKNRKRYEFVLNKDALWSDGKPVTVDDFVFGLKRVLDPKTACADIEELLAIKGARAFYSGKGKASDLGIFKLGDHLVIELEIPHASFLEVLSMPAAAPARQDVLQANGGKWDIHFPTTGPFYIKSQIVNQEITLEPNPNYKPLATLPIKLTIVPDDNTALNLFETGRIDVLTTIPTIFQKQLRDRNMVFQTASTNVAFLLFNLKKEPFDRVEWRRAVADSIDRTEIIKVLNGVGMPAGTYLPPGIEGHLPLKNMHIGNFHLARDKIRETKDKKQVAFGFAYNGVNSLVAEKIQDELKKGLGLEVILEPTEPKMFLSSVRGDPPAIFLYGMGAPYADPVNHLRLFLSDEAGLPKHNYNSPEYNRSVQRIMMLQKGAERAALITRVQKIIMEEDTVLVPLYYRLYTFAISSVVESFQINSYGVMQLGLAKMRSGTK